MPRSLTAALLAANSFLCSSCSFFRSAIASETFLSISLMLACKLSISSSNVAMVPSNSATTVFNLLVCRCISFCSSSATSSSFVQYAFLLSSATCSLPNWATSLSIMAPNLSKLAFLPRMAKAIKSKPGLARASAPKACLACRKTSLLDTCTCNSDVLGRALLKSSKASSSFRILIVSASAMSSSDRILDRASHASCFVAQFLLRSAKNLVSSPKPFFVSSRSSDMVTRLVLTSPRRADLVSTTKMRDLNSFCFALKSCV
mmetsp:Transcript_21004/g.52613  ORF Transcript_21004/g.52613 Transcript_21004/m.52613 type:complete len:260 (+) Transcript_21004:426-1205(+)